MCRCAGSIILKVTYGYDVNATGSDPVVDVVDEGVRQMDDLLSGGWLVDLIPWSMYLNLALWPAAI